MFMLSFKDEMKFDLIQHGGIPVLGVMLNRNEKRTQKFVVGAMQNLLGATGNDQTAIGAETAKLELENEAEELRQNVSALNDELAGLKANEAGKIDRELASEQAEAIRMMASVAKDIGAQYFENMEDGDDGSFEQVIINGEEALTTLEQLIANQ